MAGSGWAIEGDVCSAAYIYYPDQYQDDCAAGIKCLPLTLGDKDDWSGVCCSENSNIGSFNTSCYGCHDWQAANSAYQVRIEGRSVCSGYTQYYKYYRCANGYYGSPDSTSSGCAACPANATCTAGSNSTFLCNKGYYKSGSGCVACPSGATTSGTGATSVTQCCLPSGSAFSDAKGSGKYTAQCCYS